MKTITILALVISTSAFGDVIHVPADQATIQAGIDVTVNGRIPNRLLPVI